jgi:hypothetical protein
MTNTIHIPREAHPAATLPNDRELQVWRYMDRWKFEDLIARRQLFLCRADILQDRFEGTYSRAQLVGMNQWLATRGYTDVIAHETNLRQVNRRRFYINCWCIASCDLDLMWKAYTSGSHAVAVQSRISRLLTVCDQAIAFWPLDVSTVTYFGHAEGHFINYADGFEAFIHKDYHFQLDNEIRIIHWPNYRSQPPESVFLPIELSILIERVVLAPGAGSEDANVIRQLLDSCGLTTAPVESSRDSRELME